MKKSERLKSRIKNKFKYFILAHILTLFFALAPNVFATELPAREDDNFFNFNQEGVYSEPFSKLIEFLNDKKNELTEKQESLFETGNKVKAKNIDKKFQEKTAPRFSLNLSVGAPSPSLLSAVFESVKSFVVDKPKTYLGTIMNSAKDFVFPGPNQTGFEYKSPTNESMAQEMENLKQQYADAIEEAKSASQKFNLLQSELGKIKNSGVIIREPVIEQRTVEKTIEKIFSGLSQTDVDFRLSNLKTELNNLNTNLLNQINTLSASTNRQTSAVYQAVSLTNKIDSLTNTTITTPTMSNPTITGTLTNQTLSNSGNATISGTLNVSGLATFANATATNATIADNFWSNGSTYIGDADTDILTIRSGVWSLTSTATSTVAMTNGLNFDSNTFVIDPNSNRIGIGTTSPYAKLSIYGDVFLEGNNRYLNFGNNQGTNGFGIRENGGMIELRNNYSSTTANSSGWSPISSVSSVRYQLDEGGWVDTGINLADQVWASQAVIIGDYVYLFGGRLGESDTTNNIYRAPVSNPLSWTDTGANLPGNARYSQLTIIGDYVYLFGGVTNGPGASSIYRAPVSDPLSWVDTGSTIPTSGNLHYSQVAKIGDYVYLFGGTFWGGSVTGNIYRAPISDPLSWVDTGSDLPVGLQDSQVATIGDYVYLFGGWAGGTTNNIYRAPVSNPLLWIDTGSDLPGAVDKSQVAIVGDYIYLLGGRVSGDKIYRAPVSNPLSWTDTGLKIPNSLYESQFVIIGNYGYLFGGYGDYDGIYRVPITSNINTNENWTTRPNAPSGSWWSTSSTTNSNLVFNSGGNVGIGTTSPYAMLSVGGQVVAQNYVATSTTASTFPYASTTALTISGSAYIGSLNGPLQANNGLVSATTTVGSIYGGTGLNSSALTGLAQIVSGTWSASSTLSTAFGGTGWGNLQANTVLLGNGAGRIATTSAGTDGYVLGLSSGVPTWLATSTLSTITGTLTVAKGGTGQTSFGQGWLHSDGTTLTSSTSPTVAYITATSTTATSTFAGGMVVGSNAFNVLQNGNVGIGTTTPIGLLSLYSSGTNDIITINRVSNVANGMLKFYTAGTQDWIFGERNTEDSDFHLYSYGTGADVLTVKRTTGNIGIGSTTPFDVLSVEKNQNAPTNITVRNTTAGANAYAQFQSFNDLGYNAGFGLRSSQSTPYGVLSSSTVYVYGDSEAGIGIMADHTSGVIKFGTGDEGPERMRLDSVGKLGIGTTSPYSLLSISNSVNTTANTPLLTVASTTSGTATSTLFTILASGNVGIGTNAPSNPLHVYSSNAVGMLFERNSVSNSAIQYKNSTASMYAGVSGSANFAINSAADLSTSALFTVVRASGNVGIGTTTPNSKLTVFNSAADSAIEFSSATGDTYKWTMGMDYSDAGKFKIASSTALGTIDRFTIDGRGYVGIGTSTPARRLEVADSGTSNAQLRLTRETDVYTELNVAQTTGDLSLSLYGASADDISLYMPDGSTGANLWVCEGAACPNGISFTGGGNLFVEGTIKYATSTTPKTRRSIILTAAGAIVPATSGAAKTQVDGNHSYYVLDFDASSDEAAFWQWTMPDSYDNGVIDVTYYWEAGATSGDVIWCFQSTGISANNSEDIDPTLSPSECATDTAQANANDLALVTESATSSYFTTGEYVTFKVFRDANAGGDTMTGDARLVKVKLEYGVSAESD